MLTESELAHLLVNPNESLTLEYKSWLDLTSNHGRATLAKAAIALANEGGGTIILGLRAAEGAALASQAMPRELAPYTQDSVNSAINRYADPEIHCELVFAIHPETRVRHAFILVPGGMVYPLGGAMCASPDHALRNRSQRKNGAVCWRDVCMRAGGACWMQSA